MLLKSWSSHLVWYAKKMKLSSLKAQTKQSQMLDVIYKSALTLCAHLFYHKTCSSLFLPDFFFFTVWTDFLRWFICTYDKGAGVFGVWRERTVDISMAFPPNTGPVWHSEWGSKCSQKLRRAVSQYDPCCHIWSLTNQIPWQLMQKQTEYIEAKDSKQKVC